MIYIGTSGWQYSSWRGNFYPKELPQREWLRHYAGSLPIVYPVPAREAVSSVMGTMLALAPSPVLQP